VLTFFDGDSHQQPAPASFLEVSSPFARAQPGKVGNTDDPTRRSGVDSESYLVDGDVVVVPAEGDEIVRIMSPVVSAFLDLMALER
jgi:hypothetical protein